MRTNSLFDKAESHWSCPACSRRKTEIGCLDRQGNMLYAIVSHHDHLRNFAPDYFREHLGTNWNTILHRRCPDAGLFIDRIQAFTVGFRHVRICQPCNHIERQARSNVKAPKYFSFSSRAMRSFIDVDRQRQAHFVPDAVAATYEKLIPEFKIRLRVATRFTRDLHSGRYWHDYSLPCWQS